MFIPRLTKAKNETGLVSSAWLSSAPAYYQALKINLWELPSSASTQLNSTSISIEAEIALFPVSYEPHTRPPVEVVI